MNAKTYKARTIQEALDQIKRELGPEAVILSTQSIMKRGAFGLLRKQNWEITAAKAEEAFAETSIDGTSGLQDNVTIKTTGNRRGRPSSILGLSLDLEPARAPFVAEVPAV